MLNGFHMTRLIQIKSLFITQGVTPEMMETDLFDPKFIALDMPFDLFKEIECVRQYWDAIPCGKE